MLKLALKPPITGIPRSISSNLLQNRCQFYQVAACRQAKYSIHPIHPRNKYRKKMANIPPQVEPEGNSTRSRKRRRIAKEDVPVDEMEVYNLTPWIDTTSSKTYKTAEERLHDEIQSYVKYVVSTPEEATVRERVFLAVQAVVKQRFPYVDIQRHGSAATGLSLPGADIDVCVSMKDCKNVKAVLFTFKYALINSGITEDAFVRHTARVPILTFTTLPEYGSVSVDLGINNNDGITSIGIISGYMQKMPALKSLVLVVKGFMKQRGLANPSGGGLGSYAMILMCINFLQQNPSSRPEEYLSDPEGTKSLGFLLSDFMKYYAFDFPYATSYICVTEGKVLPKEGRDWIDTKVQNRLVIECLVGREHDVSRSLDVKHFALMIQAFKEAFDELTRNTLSSPTGLGLLVAVNRKTVDQRKRIKDIVDQGSIERLPKSPSDLNRNRRQNYNQAPSYARNNTPSYRGSFRDDPQRRDNANTSSPTLLSRIQTGTTPQVTAAINASLASSSSSGGHQEQSRRSPPRAIKRGARSRQPNLGTLSDLVTSALERNERKRDSSGRTKGGGG